MRFRELRILEHRGGLILEPVFPVVWCYKQRFGMVGVNLVHDTLNRLAMLFRQQFWLLLA